MEEVKIAWRYNPADGNKLIGSKVVGQNYKLSDGETFVAPGNGLYEPIRFDLAAQVWVGASKSEWEAAHPDPVPMPTPQQTLMAGVMKDLAGAKNDGKGQDQLNASLMKQVAQLSIANESKDKLSAQLLKDVAGLKTQLGNLQDKVEETKAQATAALTNTQASASTSQPAQPSTVTGPAQPTTASGFAQPVQPVQSMQPTQPKED